MRVLALLIYTLSFTHCHAISELDLKFLDYLNAYRVINNRSILTFNSKHYMRTVAHTKFTQNLDSIFHSHDNSYECVAKIYNIAGASVLAP